MTEGPSTQQIADTFEVLFEDAARERRILTAGEMMRAVGLQRTSIYATYPHINERRRQHNASLRRGGRAQGSISGVHERLAALTSKNAELRSELKAERERAAQYARVIRMLTLENHQLRTDTGRLTDARGRFGASDMTV